MSIINLSDSLHWCFALAFASVIADSLYASLCSTAAEDTFIFMQISCPSRLVPIYPLASGTCVCRMHYAFPYYWPALLRWAYFYSLFSGMWEDFPSFPASFVYAVLISFAVLINTTALLISEVRIITSSHVEETMTPNTAAVPAPNHQCFTQNRWHWGMSFP